MKKELATFVNSFFDKGVYRKMEEIETLYKKVFSICVQFAVYEKEDIQKRIEEIIPELNSFTTFFLEENTFKLNLEDYQLLQQLLIDILKDIMQAMENRDNILLEDTLEYGLKPFLELFLEDKKIMMLREACADEF